MEPTDRPNEEDRARAGTGRGKSDLRQSATMMLPSDTERLRRSFFMHLHLLQQQRRRRQLSAVSRVPLHFLLVSRFLSAMDGKRYFCNDSPLLRRRRVVHLRKERKRHVRYKSLSTAAVIYLRLRRLRLRRLFPLLNFFFRSPSLPSSTTAIRGGGIWR